MSHMRDGSLLKRKQEQWAREKAEKEQEVWFPFGAPGCGSPNRKHEPISYEPKPNQAKPSPPRKEEIEKERHISTSQTVTEQERTEVMEQSSYSESSTYQSREQEEQRYPAGSQFAMPPPQGYPPYLPYQPAQYPMHPYPYGYNILPPGTVPIPINMISDAVHANEGICPAEIYQQFIQGTHMHTVPMQYPQSTSYVYPVENSMISSQHSSVIDTSINKSIDKCDMEDPRPSNVAVIAPMEKSERTFEENNNAKNESYTSSHCFEMEKSDSRCESYSSRLQMEQELKRQIEARKRKEAEEAELERREAIRAENERRERENRREAEKRREEEEEEQHRRELDRRERQLADALEKAKKEAELMRKARLFKHVLAGAEKPELEQKLLGVDVETGHRVLEQVTHFERQLKRERDDMFHGKDKKKTGKESTEPQRSKSIPPKSRAMSMDSGCGSGASLNTDVPPKSTTRTVYSDDRPIRPAQNASNSAPFSRSNYGRMSLRAPRKEGKENKMRRNGSEENVSTPSRSPQKGSVLPESDAVFRETSRTTEKPAMNSTSHTNLSRIPVPTTRSRSRSIIRDPEPMTSHSAGYNFAEALQLINNIPADEFVPKLRPRVRNPVPAVDDAFNPLFSPISTRSRRMRPTLDSPVNLPADAMGGGSMDSNQGSSNTSSAHTSPIPSINVESDYDKPIMTTPKRLDLTETRLRSRSALTSPAYYLNGASNGRQSPLAAGMYAKKIAEKGCAQHAEDVLSPDIRRRAEATLSRQSSMASLRGSLSSLRASTSNLSLTGEDSPAALARYKSMNPTYRSFNMKKTSDKQKDTLERLSRLREQLRSKENFVDRSPMAAISRHNSRLSLAKQ